MALKDTHIRSVKVPKGKRQVKLADSGGLYLLVTATGGKLWRFDYRYAGKRKTLALGRYPDVSLKKARARRDDAREKVADGIDPSEDRKDERLRKARESEEKARQTRVAEKPLHTFEPIARQWMKRQRSKWGDKHASKIQGWFERDVFPWMGDCDPNAIDAADVLAVLHRIEAAGHIEKLHRMKSAIQRVFAHAVAHGEAKRNPAADISSRDALTPLVSKHRAAIKTPKEAGALMRAIHDYQGDFAVRCGLMMLAYVFTRPGELRFAEWNEFDLDAATWRIPSGKMKMRRPHIVPLSRQVLAILQDLQPLTGRGKYLFPSVRTPDRAMSENTLNAALRRMGYGKDEMCSHGFRGMASTLLHEQGWPSGVIECQLAHKDTNAVRAAYNHAEHLQDRVKMMQAWADYLDSLRDGADVIPIGMRA